LKIKITITAIFASALTALAFVNQLAITTGPLGTNSTVQATTSASGSQAIGTVHRVILAIAGDPAASGTVTLVDKDGTIFATTNLVVGVPATLDGLEWPTGQISLVLSNASATNLAAVATITLEQ